MRRIQKVAQDRVIEPLLKRGTVMQRPPIATRTMDRFPWHRQIPGRVIGMEFGRQDIRNPNAFPEV